MKRTLGRLGNFCALNPPTPVKSKLSRKGFNREKRPTRPTVLKTEKLGGRHTWRKKKTTIVTDSWLDHQHHQKKNPDGREKA